MSSTSTTTALERDAKQTVLQAESSLENAGEQIAAGQIDTKDTSARYLGYLARIRPVLITSSRYLAYTSDVGEAARPIAHPRWITAAYGVSWSYLVGDVAYEGYKASLKVKELELRERMNEIVGLQVAKRAIFQSVASMAFPAFTIHSIVRYSAKALANHKTPFIRQWAPSILGLSAIPALPFLFDEPVEHVVDAGFEKVHQYLYKDAKDRDKVFKALSGHPPNPEKALKQE